MDQPAREDSGCLPDSVDRERLGRLVVSRYAPPKFTEIPAARSKPRRTLLLLISTAAFLALAVAGLVSYLLLWSPASSISERRPVVVEQAPSNPIQAYIPVNVKHEMISIPGGTFKMGRDEGPLQSRPSHTVTVGSFFLDSTEVTRAEYAVFIKDTNYPAPEGWIPGNPSLEESQLPVINVSSEDAKAFASWRSKRDGVVYRLPTEAEWEYAARNGGRETIYPWGNDWLDNHAATLEMGLNGPLPVGSLPEGRNQWGVYDLLGNVWEWTSSRASLYPGFVEKSSISAATRDWVVARGGSYGSDPNDKQIPMSSTYRDWFSPTFKHKAFGFRLARSIP